MWSERSWEDRGAAGSLWPLPSGKPTQLSDTAVLCGAKLDPQEHTEASSEEQMLNGP